MLKNLIWSRLLPYLEMYFNWFYWIFNPQIYGSCWVFSIFVEKSLWIVVCWERLSLNTSGVVFGVLSPNSVIQRRRRFIDFFWLESGDKILSEQFRTWRMTLCRLLSIKSRILYPISLCFVQSLNLAWNISYFYYSLYKYSHSAYICVP